MALGELGAGRASSASPGCMNPTAVLCLPQPWLWDVVLKAKNSCADGGLPQLRAAVRGWGTRSP